MQRGQWCGIANERKTNNEENGRTEILLLGENDVLKIITIAELGKERVKDVDWIFDKLLSTQNLVTGP